MNNKREKKKSRWALQLKPQWIYRSSGSQIVFFILSETIVNAGRTKGQENLSGETCKTVCGHMTL